PVARARLEEHEAEVRNSVKKSGRVVLGRNRADEGRGAPRRRGDRAGVISGGVEPRAE
ncbi:unnamed protein product, partial [Musa hybrid cultivar]